MPREGADLLTAFVIPQKYLARRASTTTACDLSPIWTPGDTSDAPRVPDQRLEYLPIFSAPNPHGAIFTTTRQPAPIRAPCKIVDHIRMCAADPAALAGGCVPQSHGLIATRTGEPLPIRTPCDAIDNVVVRLNDSCTDARRRFPDPDRLVISAAGEPLSIRAPGCRIHGMGMSIQRLYSHALGHVPHSECCVVVGAQQTLTIRAPCDSEKVEIIALDDAHRPSALDIPGTHGLVIAAADQAAAVGSKCDCVDRSHTPEQNALCRITIHVPQANRRVRTRTGDDTPIGTPGDRLHLTGMLGERLETLPAGEIPDLHRRVKAATGQQPAIRRNGQFADPARVSGQDRKSVV